MALADVVAVFRADTSQFTAKLGEMQAQVDKMSTAGSSSFQKMSSLATAALKGIGVGVAAAAVAAVDFGDKLENAQAAASNAFKNAGTSTAAYSGQIAAVNAKMTQYGYTNADTEAALARLVGATGNVKESLADMGLAADIAKARHMDLNSAADLLAKTMDGNTAAAKRMGINIPASVLAIQDPTQKANAIMAILEDRFKGSAAAAASTFAGHIAKVKAQGENLAASIGLRLIPVLEQVMNVISSVVTWLEKHRTAAIALGVGLGIATAALIAMSIAGAIAEATFSPVIAIVGAVVVAIGLLVLAVVEIVKHWSAISGFFAKLWGDVKKIFDDAIHAITGFVKQWWPEILGIMTGGIGLIVGLLIQHWSQIKADVQAMISAVVGFFTALPGEIVGVLANIVSTIWAPFAAAASWITTNVISPVVSTFTQLPDQIAKVLSNVVATIFSGLTSAASWIDANVLVPVVSYFTGLPKRIYTGLGNIVGTIFQGLVGADTWVTTNIIDPVANAFTSLPSAIAKAIGGAIGAIGSAATAIINGIIGVIDSAIDTINSHIPTVFGVKIFPSIPDIPKLAAGGIVPATPGGTLALIGEAGYDELVLPLGGPNAPSLTSGVPTAGPGGSSPVGSSPVGGSAPGAGNVVNITNNITAQPNATAADIAREIGWTLRNGMGGLAMAVR